MHMHEKLLIMVQDSDLVSVVSLVPQSKNSGNTTKTILPISRRRMGRSRASDGEQMCLQQKPSVMDETKERRSRNTLPKRANKTSDTFEGGFGMHPTLFFFAVKFWMRNKDAVWN